MTSAHLTPLGRLESNVEALKRWRWPVNERRDGTYLLALAALRERSPLSGMRMFTYIFSAAVRREV